MLRIISPAGQTFIDTCERVLRKPSNQDVVNTLFDVIAHYFESIRPDNYDDDMNIITLVERASNCCETCLDTTSVERREILATMPEMQDSVKAMLILSGLGYSVLKPIFSRTTAIGSLMRKKLAPVTEPILEQLTILRQ
ncbi:protein involved in sulfur oxidation dsrS [Candidatus Thiomargarita nelsonii]|uniref:Protein involved in sulfur oxidation dsrS n=1 Tax=Candidatus Thiomargarita nelsonii TaxID=1003181 RepID=A0A176S1S3_9GAMM|nr:protein involved in sulfur oxidation dsrS [Candidatus Thiomargarita nelsonii]